MKDNFSVLEFQVVVIYSQRIEDNISLCVDYVVLQPGCFFELCFFEDHLFSLLLFYDILFAIVEMQFHYFGPMHEFLLYVPKIIAWKNMYKAKTDKKSPEQIDKSIITMEEFNNWQKIFSKNTEDFCTAEGNTAICKWSIIYKKLNQYVVNKKLMLLINNTSITQ